MKSGVLQGYSRALIEEGRPTLPSLLKAQGYATAGIGKWHLGFQPFDPRRGERDQPVDYSRPLRPGPMTVGFDEFFGIPASLDMPPYLFVENERPTEMPTATVGDSGDAQHARGPFWRKGAMAPSFRHADVLPRLTERAVSFLDRQAENVGGAAVLSVFGALRSAHALSAQRQIPWAERRGRLRRFCGDDRRVGR